MGRSLKKGPFVDPKLYTKVEKQNREGAKQPIKTWARACTIVPEFVGHTFMVHNGKIHVKVFVTEEMVGGMAPGSVIAKNPPETTSNNW